MANLGHTLRKAETKLRDTRVSYSGQFRAYRKKGRDQVKGYQSVLGANLGHTLRKAETKLKDTRVS